MKTVASIPAPRWRRLVLETTPKPFYAVEGRSFDQTAEHIMRAWRPLIERSDRLAMLLFIGDGNEVYEWSGDMEQRLEWARYVGFCNQDAPVELGLYYADWFSDRPGVPFREGLPESTYGDLLKISKAIRAAAERVHGLPCELGVAIDPGPEFSQSRFKYHEHPEVLVDYFPDGPRSSMRFLDFTATLKADTLRYAAFPKGLTEGITFGHFVARQLKDFNKTFGIDYLWLSNGLGYSPLAWSQCGEGFHAGRFHPDRLPPVTAAVTQFWRDLRKELPDLPVEVRGTDSSVGHDLSVHGASHRAIQQAGRLDMEPTNLPVLRAELLAKEVVVYLTRLAGAPTDRVIYRNYLNDPWFEHDPWEDIYGREPFEIYCAMACGRLRHDGSMLAPTDLHFLAIDDEQGAVSDRQAMEVAPHLMRALDERPTEAGPLTWVYPFSLFHDLLETRREALSHAYFQDHFMWRSVEGGLPLTTVCNDVDFLDLASRECLPESVYLIPVVPGGKALVSAGLKHVEAGGDVVFLGPLDAAPADLMSALRLHCDGEPLEGDFRVSQMLPGDLFEKRHDSALPLRHHAVTSGGGLRETIADADSAEPLIELDQGGLPRVYAARGLSSGQAGRGRMCWFRGGLPFGPNMPQPHLKPDLDDPRQFQRVQDWLRLLIGEFGWVMRQDRTGPSVEPTRWLIHRHQGAFGFVGSKADTTVTTQISTPYGAPLFSGYETQVVSGLSLDPFGKTIHNAVRVFVQTTRDTTFRVRPIPPGEGWSAGLTVEGCQPQDTFTCFPGNGAADGRFSLTSTPRINTASPAQEVPFCIKSDRLIVERHNGALFMKW